MSMLHGVYLLFTLGCTYFVIYKYLLKKWKPAGKKEISPERLAWAGQKAKIVAFLIIFAAWWFQDEYST